MAEDSANDEIKFLRDRVRQLEEQLSMERRARAAIDNELVVAYETVEELRRRILTAPL